MTLTMPLNISHQISPDLVLRQIPNAEITCRWCRRLAELCDGQTTLAQALEQLHLPLSTGQRLARRSLHEHWLEPVGGLAVDRDAGTLLEHFRADLLAVLQQTPGLDAVQVIERASGMIRLEREWLSLEDIASYLLAVELLLPEETRDRILPLLDALKLRYAG